MRSSFKRIKSRISQNPTRGRRASSTASKQKKSRSASRTSTARGAGTGRYKKIHTKLLSKKQKGESKIALRKDGIMVFINRAEDLPPGDFDKKGASSDPFIEFSFADANSKPVVSTTKFKTLNPVWDDFVFIPVEDFSQPLQIKIYDRDTLLNDKLASTSLDISELVENDGEPVEKTLELELYDSIIKKLNARNYEYEGKPKLKIFVHRSLETEEVYYAPKWKPDPNDSISKQLVVDLVCARGLMPMDPNGRSDPFCKLTFQGTTLKSKVAALTLDPNWRQRFEFKIANFNDLYNVRTARKKRKFTFANAADMTVSSRFLQFMGKEKGPVKVRDEAEILQDPTKGFKLQIQLYDKDRFPKKVEYMGDVEVDLSMIPLAVNKSYPLFCPVLFDGKKHGHIELVISVLDPFSDPRTRLRLKQFVSGRKLGNSLQFNWEQSRKGLFQVPSAMTALWSAMTQQAIPESPQFDNEMVYRPKTRLGSITVQVIQGRKPISSGFSGIRGAKPKICYVECAMAHETRRTVPSEDNPTPVFDSVLKFDLVDMSDFISIKLVEKKLEPWDKEGKVVGELRLPVRMFFEDHFFGNKYNKYTELKFRGWNNEFTSAAEWFILKDPSITAAKSTATKLRLAFKLDVSPKLLMPQNLLAQRPSNPMRQRQPVGIMNYTPLRRNVERMLDHKRAMTEFFEVYTKLAGWEYGARHTILFMLSWMVITLTFRVWYLPFGIACLLLWTKYDEEHYLGDPLELEDDAADPVVEKDKPKKDNSEVFANTAATENDKEKKEGLDDPDSFADQHDSIAVDKIKTSLLDKIGISNQVLIKASHLIEDLADYFERFIGVFCWSNRTLTLVVLLACFSATLALMIVPFNVVCCLGLEYQFIRQGLTKYNIAFIRPKFSKKYYPVLEMLKRVPTEQERRAFAKIKKTEEKERELSTHPIVVKPFVHHSRRQEHAYRS